MPDRPLALANFTANGNKRESLTGIGEVVLLPLDVLKIKRQVNPEAFRGRGVVCIFLEEGTTLYCGWGWTMARNAPGSFALFGASAPPGHQTSSPPLRAPSRPSPSPPPLDVVKTRIQNANFESKVPGFTVVRELVKNEGAGAFFKGLTPKILVVGPKLVFSYTLAQSLIPLFATYF
ncbi:mitochondrial carrier domain-containing protein [Mycena olivaceomarginata]|nr:mitochondrial carrier domain-containing protein [Mycena olivaceomarginata]